MNPFKPKKIGKYYLVEPIGEGGMGNVYRGKLIGAGTFAKEVAIKMISKEGVANPESLAMFEAEATICSRLNHPNIITVFDFFNSPQGFLMAMEYLPGKNLREIMDRAKLKKIPLSLEAILFLSNEILRGLDYAHHRKDSAGSQLNLIHRDISPQNIMISYDGAIKIVDFGLAKSRDRQELTQTGTIKGKIIYMSPEQASGKPLDLRSDLFSFALVIYEMLTGVKPFRADSEGAAIARVLACEIPSLRSLSPELPLELDSVFAKALSKDREERYASAREFADALRPIAKVLGGDFDSKKLNQLMESLFGDQIIIDRERSQEILSLTAPEENERTIVERNQDLIPAGAKPLISQRPSRPNIEPEMILVGLAVLALLFLGFMAWIKGQVINSAENRPEAQLNPPPLIKPQNPIAQIPPKEMPLAPPPKIIDPNEEALKKSLLNALAQWDSNSPSAKIDLISAKEVLRRFNIYNRPNEIWTNYQMMGNNTTYSEVITEITADSNKLPQIVNDYSHYTNWLNEVVDPKFNLGTLHGFDPSKREFYATMVESGGHSAERIIRLESRNKAGYQNIKMEMPVSSNSPVKTITGQFYLIPQKDKPGKYIFYAEWYVVLTNSVVYRMLEDANIAKKWNIQLTSGLIKKYEHEEKRRRDLASEK